MRELSSTLLAAQKSSSRVPCIKVEVKNKIAGLVRLDWERLYTGTEADYFHAAVMPADGSLIRVRVTPPDDSRKLYRQRVANPSPSSDFTNWVYTGYYNVAAVACARLGSDVSIFWLNGSTRGIYWLKSSNNGETWEGPELIDYTPTTSVYGLAAAYKPNSDIAIFFADQATLYVKKYIDGTWQSRLAWDKTTGDLSGVACLYDGDWELLITGKDSSDNYHLWSLVYGDGGSVPADTWSDLKPIASAPSDAGFDYRNVFLDKPDACRFFVVEHYAGTESYYRPYWAHLVPETSFIDNLWREPVPFDLSSEYGLAITHSGSYGWLTRPNGVWRARLTAQSLDLSADVLSIKKRLAPDEGSLAIELRNDNRQYASPGTGSLGILDSGCQVEFSPGYRTASGNEYSSGQAFVLDSYEHACTGGKATLVLRARDGWELVHHWRARHQFRWNKDSEERNVKQILEFVLARAGLKLSVRSSSSDITSLYPDFTIQAGNDGGQIVGKLLSLVPDVLFIEGNKAYLVNPQSSDGSVYSYGVSHAILEGIYRKAVKEYNRVRVEGFASLAEEPILSDTFDWSELNRLFDRLEQIEDSNLDTTARTQARGGALLRRVEVMTGLGSIRVPVNCGQQLYDVIDLTDSFAGLTAARRRVLGLSLSFTPRRGEYEQVLVLGGV